MLLIEVVISDNITDDSDDRCHGDGGYGYSKDGNLPPTMVMIVVYGNVKLN